MWNFLSEIDLIPSNFVGRHRILESHMKRCGHTSGGIWGCIRSGRLTLLALPTQTPALRSAYCIELTSCTPGWAAAGPAQPLHRFDTAVEQTWRNSHSALLNLARVLLSGGQTEEALNIYRHSTSLWPSFADGTFTLRAMISATDRDCMRPGSVQPKPWKGI